MFWIAVLGGTFSWLLIKLGAMSATVGFLTLALKLLFALLIFSVLSAAWTRVRRKA